MAYSVKIDPIGKPRMTRQDRWTDKKKGKGRPAVLRYFEWQDQLRAALPGYRLPPCLALTFYLPMPKSWPKKQRTATIGAPHTQTPDIDNLCKAVMDTLATNDSYIYDLRAVKRWSEEGSIEFEGYSTGVTIKEAA